MALGRDQRKPGGARRGPGKQVCGQQHVESGAESGLPDHEQITRGKPGESLGQMVTFDEDGPGFARAILARGVPVAETWRKRRIALPVDDCRRYGIKIRLHAAILAWLWCLLTGKLAGVIENNRQSMNTPTRNLALFCDFENIALGVRDARYSAFDIKKVLERLLLKGNIVVKKAYCDWQRYKEFKPAMHEAAFELIEIPHLRMSGKNSADIRMVVDALDLCYTKAHVDTFVVISGDSDFSPLVSKLRENNKLVIGVGVKSSTSDLLTANCDEFIFYDDLVRDSEKKSERKQRAAKKKSSKKARKKAAPAKAASNGDASSAPANDTASSEEERRQEAFDLVLETIEALFRDRDESETVWGSMVKQTLKRRRPGFSESYHGFKSFGQLLEQMQSSGIVKLRHDEKSGGYIIESFVSDD